jgi:GNAT superfamily N-acetyltransferase
MANNNQQKIIMEGWRDFIGSLFGKPNIDDHLALALFSVGDNFQITLYMPNKIKDDKPVFENKGPIVIGMMMIGPLTSSETPCIPKTFQVKYTAVGSKYQGKGLGTLLYKIAAQQATAVGGGITSDHDIMTSNSAARVWDKIENSPDFQKRKTPSGSDEFDYTGNETPSDPKDDCKTPESSKNTVDHSYELTADISSTINSLRQRHKEYETYAIPIYGDKMKFLDKLNRLGIDLFSGTFQV